MNLCVYWKYAEWMCTNMEQRVIRSIFQRNVAVCICWIRRWIWSYAENTRNESVRILRIHGTNLFVYWEYAECMKGQISLQMKNKNRQYFRTFFRLIDRFVWPNHFKRENLMQVFLWAPPTPTSCLPPPPPNGLRSAKLCEIKNNSSVD